jgi:mevalonate kinase
VIGQSWFANGKVLITGEYLVMEGAKALALPLKFGQYLTVKDSKEPFLLWTAMKQGGIWFQTKFTLPELKIVSSTDVSLGKKLKKILQEVKKQNAGFLNSEQGLDVETLLEFDPDHGFGSSSTLIANIARWAKVDPYLLLKNTFGGSGYDIACATSRSPVVYQLVGSKPKVEKVFYDPVFKENIFFVYLGNKKRSTEGIKYFKSESSFSESDIQAINRLTDQIISTNSLEEFEAYLREHERIMSGILNLPTAQSIHFPDFDGVVKSLGAWGGDFVLLTSRLKEKEVKKYIAKKGFAPVYTFSEAVFVEH